LASRVPRIALIVWEEYEWDKKLFPDNDIPPVIGIADIPTA
jgi:hypothetical protein